MGDSLESAPQRFVPAGSFEKSARQRSIIEARPAGNDRQLPAGRHLADDTRRITRITRCRVLLRRIDDIDQVVRNAVLLRRGNLVGPDVEPPIDGSGIAGDDFPVEPLRERDGECAFSCSRGADDRDEWGTRQDQMRRASA